MLLAQPRSLVALVTIVRTRKEKEGEREVAREDKGEKEERERERGGGTCWRRLLNLILLLFTRNQGLRGVPK